MMRNLPGMNPAFPPWLLSAYGIAVRHGFAGTERDFWLALRGEDGEYASPALLVTEEAEEEIDGELYMRPSSDEYAYETGRNEFRAADREIKVPDGLSVSGAWLRLKAAGVPFGAACILPEAALPAVTDEDDGKIMTVDSGAWAPEEL